MKKWMKIVLAVAAVGLMGMLYAGGSFDRHLLAYGLNATPCFTDPMGAQKIKCGQEAEVLEDAKKEMDKQQKELEAEQERVERMSDDLQSQIDMYGE